MNKKLKTFYITSTIEIKAKNIEEAKKLLIRPPQLNKPNQIMFDLFDNAEIDEYLTK